MRYYFITFEVGDMGEDVTRYYGFQSLTETVIYASKVANEHKARRLIFDMAHIQVGYVLPSGVFCTPD